MGSVQDDILDTSLFSFEGDFNQQIEELLTRVRLTRSEVENLQCLFEDLTRILGNKWPGTKVHPFGSVITGLGIKTSDVDCYIQLPFDYSVQSSVMRAKFELNKYESLFADTFAIVTAKVPIVKFVHIPTRFNCDINFSSKGGVRNSKLIAFLLGLDTRALQLAVLIKYWSKVYNFTGTNLLANYSLTMMVIFYLQEKSVLPSVAEIQQQTEYRFVEGWNTAFNNNFFYVSDNAQSLYELLGGFFDYYKSFDYAQYVISPYLGRPVRKQMLEDLNALPVVYGLYKECVLREECTLIKLDTPMCIQDPFDHSRNCTVALHAKLFSKIITHIELAHKTFQEKPIDDFLKGLFTLKIPNASKILKKVNPKLGFKKRKGRHKTLYQVQKEHFRQYYQSQFQKHKAFKGY